MRLRLEIAGEGLRAHAAAAALVLGVDVGCEAVAAEGLAVGVAAPNRKVTLLPRIVALCAPTRAPATRKSGWSALAQT